MLKLHIRPFQLAFKYPFRISHGKRSHTDAVFIAIEKDGVLGYGEATLPPYLTDNTTSSIAFLQSIDLTKSYAQFTENPWQDLFPNSKTDMPAKAALNMAFWDLKAKIEGQKVSDYFSTLLSAKTPFSTYTIGVSDEAEMQNKLADAQAFKLIKLKLDGKEDKAKILLFRKYSDKPFAVDANQAWHTLDEAKAMHDFLITQNCFLIEQAFAKSDRNLSRAFQQYSHIPLIADEAFQTIEELDEIADCYDGINIKLMKCGGISAAENIIKKAQAANLKILLGCMSESACGCAAAASLQTAADWTDLDGPWLISNNPFTGYDLKDGSIHTEGASGLGIETQLFQ